MARTVGTVRSADLEDYGLVQSRRVRYENGIEVEFGITTVDWLNTMPIDEGSRRVISEGHRILDDKTGLFADFLAVVQKDQPNQEEAIVGTTAASRSRDSTFRGKLPRVYELKDMLTDPLNPDAYFQNFEDGLEQNTSKLNAFMKLEGWLNPLDDEAWKDLKERAAVHLVSSTRNAGRGWQTLFDVFSEARAFGYLRSIGCTAVRFIKRAAGKTPDLSAARNGGLVLCEVKTINISQDEAERRQRITQGAIVASSTSVHVGEKFLQKLSSTLKHAVEQLDSFDPGRKASRLLFVLVHFDDWVGDYQPEYFAQIDEHLLRNPIEGAELVLCPFSNLFGRAFTMRSATVLLE